MSEKDPKDKIFGKVERINWNLHFHLHKKKQKLCEHKENYYLVDDSLVENSKNTGC